MKNRKTRSEKFSPRLHLAPPTVFSVINSDLFFVIAMAKAELAPGREIALLDLFDVLGAVLLWVEIPFRNKNVEEVVVDVPPPCNLLWFAFYWCHCVCVCVCVT